MTLRLTSFARCAYHRKLLSFSTSSTCIRAMPEATRCVARMERSFPPLPLMTTSEPHGRLFASDEPPARSVASERVSAMVPTWDELYRVLPAEFRPYALELAWDRRLLWELELPVEEMSVAELE